MGSPKMEQATNPTTEIVKPTAREKYSDSISACCLSTIDDHAAFNPMIVCQSCMHLIKCFKEKDAFDNYITFCQSRGRSIVTGYHKPYHVVILRRYDKTLQSIGNN